MKQAVTHFSLSSMGPGRHTLNKRMLKCICTYNLDH